MAAVQEAKKDATPFIIAHSGAFHGYTSPNVRLLVGPEKVEFNVQKDILMRLPYFRICLDGQFAEASTKTVELPEDDPEATAELLHWFYTRRTPPIVFNSVEEPRDSEERAQVMLRVRTYACADKYGDEDLLNAISDSFVRYHESRFVVPATITFLTEAGLRDSALRQFFVTHLANSLVGNNQHASWAMFTARDAEFERNLLELLPDDVLDVLKKCHLMRSHVFTSKPLTNAGCAWHQHKVTPVCPLPQKPPAAAVEEPKKKVAVASRTPRRL